MWIDALNYVIESSREIKKILIADSYKEKEIFDNIS